MPFQAAKPYSISDTELNTWQERGRLHIALINRNNDRTIMEFWDEDAASLLDDGFLETSGIFGRISDSDRLLHESLYEYAVYLGCIKPGAGGVVHYMEQA